MIVRRWSGARWWRTSALIAVLVGSSAATLGAQTSRYDSTVVSVAGSGPTTYVLVSGVVGSVAGFRRLADVLKQNHRVITIDPYRIAIDSADVTFAALARVVDAVLDEYGVDSARVVGHAHGAGVALRLAASSPRRVAALYFLDAGAIAENKTKVFSSSLRLAPLIARLPGGRGFVRGRFTRGLRQNAGRQEWLDSATMNGYTEPFLDHLSKVVTMAGRLSRAREPESRLTLIERIHVPVTLIIGALPHPTEPDSAQLAALAPLGPLLRIERLEGVGHFPHEEATSRVAELLMEGAAIRSGLSFRAKARNRDRPGRGASNFKGAGSLNSGSFVHPHISNSTNLTP
ncbi:MAG TPA: alpha/beta hydrolase [Gemmatimonadaceae bacterium]|nr:alpha/beta hydrolase [Gemmatimonadaceae bacterium]